MNSLTYDQKTAYLINYERVGRLCFFSSKDSAATGWAVTHSPLETPPAAKPVVPEMQQNHAMPERVNVRTPVRSNRKQIITRNSFEIYEDQMDSLRKLSIEEKMMGKLGSMSAMVREAIDTYLHTRFTDK